MFVEHGLDTAVTTDPVTCSRHPRVDARIVGLGAAQTPRYNSHELSVGHQWTTGVSLAGILTTLLETGTNHAIRNSTVQCIGFVTLLLIVGWNVSSSKFITRLSDALAMEK